jgi:hypothetical protein
MMNTRRLSAVWSAVALALAVLVLPGCSADHGSLTPTGPAVPSPVNPVARVVLSGSVTDLLNAPIAGAVVTAFASSRPTTVTDAAGQFRFESVEVGLASFQVSVQKAGYVTRTWAVRTDGEPSPLKLPPLFQLPIDASTTSEIVATDLPDYVGEAYESDYSYNTKYFSFSIPSTADVIVEISWERVENSSLMMWAFDGTVVSGRTSTGAVIRLPRGSTGMLLIGRPHSAGQLSQSQSVTFTLTTRQTRDAAS